MNIYPASAQPRAEAKEHGGFRWDLGRRGFEGAKPLLKHLIDDLYRKGLQKVVE